MVSANAPRRESIGARDRRRRQPVRRVGARAATRVTSAFVPAPGHPPIERGDDQERSLTPVTPRHSRAGLIREATDTELRRPERATREAPLDRHVVRALVSQGSKVVFFV